MAACEQQVVYPVDYNITLDKENTYRVGEPVKFNFKGEVDNVLFYSGETGHQYKFKDRYEVPVEDVLSANLDMSILAQYGYQNGLSIYITDKFEGLKGNDGAADRARMAELFGNLPEGGVPEGWKKIDYLDDKASGKTERLSIPISEYMSNFCVALHWNPVMDGKSAQRTYKMDGDITIEIEGTDPSSMSFKDLGFTVLTMNEENDPYHKNASNGSIITNKNDFDIICQGVPATFEYRLDVWCISTPMPLSKVANDKGDVIKDLQNYMDSYEYTWNEPGTYTVTFVGVNSNYAGASKVVKEFTITILDEKTEF